MKEPDNLYRIEERAGVDLKLIRAMMQHALLVTPMPGWGISAIGLIGIVATFFTRDLQGPVWVAGWGLTAIVAVILALLISNWHIRKNGKSIYVGGYARFWLSLLPAFISAGLLTWVFIALEQFAYLPAMWLLLYGVAVIAASLYSIPLVRWMGLTFLALGIVIAVFPSTFFPTTNIAMGLGFGGIHLVFGILITRASFD